MQPKSLDWAKNHRATITRESMQIVKNCYMTIVNHENKKVKANDGTSNCFEKVASMLTKNLIQYVWVLIYNPF